MHASNTLVALAALNGLPVTGAGHESIDACTGKRLAYLRRDLRVVLGGKRSSLKVRVINTLT